MATAELAETEFLPATLPSATSTPGFAIELSDRIGELRAALGRMLAELGSPKSASDLHRLSGAGQTICWRVFRIVNADELATEARRAPSPSSLKRLLAAASTSGVSEKTIQSVQNSAEAFEAFSKRAAGDRAAFESMLAGVTSEESSDRILMSQRRAVYRGLSHIWGVQTDMHYYSTIMHLSASGDTLDAVALNVQRGIRRLRPDCKVTLLGYRPSHNELAGASHAPTPLDLEAAEKYGIPVLPRFSSEPLPKVERIVLPSGRLLFNTLDHEIGPRGNVDYSLGRIARGMQISTDTDGRRLVYMTMAHINKPAAMSIQEMVVHRPSFPDAKPMLKVYQYHEGELSQEAARKAMQFPVDEQLTLIGRADRVELMEVPRYSELLRMGADTAGWDLSEFDVYRFRMSYPIMFSESRIFFYLD